MSAQQFHQTLHRATRAIVGACAWRLPHVAYLLPTRAPLSILKYGSSSGRKDRDLLVLMPGIGDTAASYQQHGFVTEALRRKDTDVWAVDAHIGYYIRRTIVGRLYQDVIGPALREGYRSITIAGISLGGFGALLYASEYPDTVQRIIAVAPFLGGSPIVQEAREPRPSVWNRAIVTARDYERRLWIWLRESVARSEGPALYLGYGDRDPFSAEHRLLSAILPQEHVFAVPGGHTWSTWRTLWPKLLHQVERKAVGDIASLRTIGSSLITSACARFP